VRHGHLPEREIMTGIGPVAVRQPRVRDREAAGGERIRFSPTILPPYARRTKSLEVLIPILYLKGISTGDFEEAFAALLGQEAGGLSASTIARLKEAWSTNIPAGSIATCPPNGMSMSGPMASTSRLGSKMTRSACS
jgi:putative transposase